MRRSLAFALCLASIAASSQAQIGARTPDRVRFEIEVNAWDPDLSGQILIAQQGVGDTLDLEGDLGLAADSVNDLRITFHPSRRTEIRLARMPLSYSGDTIVSRTIEFAGQTFTLSTRVLSQLNLDYVRAGFAWQFLSSSDGRFRIGPLLEVKGFEGDSSLSAPDIGIPVSAVETFEVGFGTAGLAFDLEPTDRIHVFGEFSTLVSSDIGDQTELEVGVRVALWGPLTAQAGFRSISIDVVDKDDAVDFDIDGVFLGAALRF